MGGFFKKWSKKEDDVVKKYWFNCPREIISKLLPLRHWQSIGERARKLGLKRDQTSLEVNPLRKLNFKNGINKLNKLLEETPEAYYWIGFIMADGHISSNRLRLSIRVATKDAKHIEQLAKFINKSKINYSKTSVGFTIDGNIILSKIVKKFNFNHLKTYYPPKVNIKSNNLFLAFLIGFIDGDGCITKHKTIQVKCHISWRDNLEKWFNRFYKLSCIENFNLASPSSLSAKVTCDGYAVIYAANSKALSFLKQRTIDLKLPFLKRKWNRIPLKYSTYYERGAQNRKNVAILISKGKSVKQIATKLNIGERWVDTIKRRLTKGCKNATV